MENKTEKKGNVRTEKEKEKKNKRKSKSKSRREGRGKGMGERKQKGKAKGQNKGERGNDTILTALNTYFLKSLYTSILMPLGIASVVYGRK